MTHCKGTTKDGTKCKRIGTNNGYCWQHIKSGGKGNKKDIKKDDKLLNSIIKEMNQNIKSHINSLVREHSIVDWTPTNTEEFIMKKQKFVKSKAKEMIKEYSEGENPEEIYTREADWVREYIFDEEDGIKYPKRFDGLY